MIGRILKALDRLAMRVAVATRPETLTQSRPKPVRDPRKRRQDGGDWADRVG